MSKLFDRATVGNPHFNERQDNYYEGLDQDHSIELAQQQQPKEPGQGKANDAVSVHLNNLTPDDF